MNLHAHVGDGIVVDSMELGHPPRKGEVLAVMGDGDTEHYLVRWDDGRDSYFYPGNTSHVIHASRCGSHTAIEQSRSAAVERAQHPAGAGLRRRA
jgi:hypothetical protein